jgi:hypothetical protein
MTRPAQKQAERRTLNNVIDALGLRLDSQPQQDETPDFLLCAGGRRIGVEITTYRSGVTVEGGTERRPIESEWERLKQAADVLGTERRPAECQHGFDIQGHGAAAPPACGVS